MSESNSVLLTMEPLKGEGNKISVSVGEDGVIFVNIAMMMPPYDEYWRYLTVNKIDYVDAITALAVKNDKALNALEGLKLSTERAIKYVHEKRSATPDKTEKT